MVDKIQGGLLIDDGGYWGGASRRQKKQQESLAGHYNGLYSQTTRPQERRDYASRLWNLIVDDKAGAINTDIFYGVLAGVDLMNLEKISEFQKVLEQSHAIQDHVLSTIFGFADTEATERRKKSIPTYFQQTSEDVDAGSLVAISSVDAAQLEYITATIKEATKSLSSLFQNHIFALNLFQKCPKFIARCSDDVLLGYALNNSGAAYCIFADPKLRAKVLPKVTVDHIPTLIAGIPGPTGSFGRSFFDGFFVNALSDTKELIATGILKTAATAQTAPETFTETPEGKREETKWKAIERIRSYFYRTECKPDAFDYPLGAYLQQHPEVVVELCGGKEALDLTRLKQLINLHPDPVEFVIALAQSQLLQDFIIKNLDEIFVHVESNIQKDEQSSLLSLTDKYKSIDTFLQKNPAMVLRHCGGADHFELEKLLKLTDLCQDPVGFIKSLAKNPTTSAFITNNIGDIVLHLQKKMEDAGVEHSSIQNKINALLKCGITGDCVYVPSSGNQLALSKTLRGHLYKEVLSLSAEDRTRKAEDLGKEDVQKKRDKYLSLFCNDHLRGQLNFGKNRYDRDAWVLRNILDVSEDHTPDQTLCFTIASDNSLWNRVKGIYTEADLKGKSVYFQARIALDNGSITHANFATLNPGLKTAVSALVAARPKLFWPKIKKPDYGLWARFWHTVSKGSFYRSAHEKYRGFSRFVSENSLLSGKFAITETGLGKRSNFELRKEEDDSSVTFSKYLVAQVQADYSLLSNDSGNVFKQVICEGASPKELLDVLANDSSGKLILYVVQNKKYLNKLLRNTTEDLQALPGKLSPLSSALHYFNAEGSCIVLGVADQMEKDATLQGALIQRIPELIVDVKVFYADLSKIYDIAIKAGSQELLLALLRNSVAKSAALFKKPGPDGLEVVERAFTQTLLKAVLDNAAQLNQGATQAAFSDFIKYFIENNSWLAQHFFENVSAAVLCDFSKEVQKSNPILLGELLNKLNTHKQVSKVADIVGRLAYEVIVGNEVVTKVLTPEVLAVFSLGGLLHLFSDDGKFFNSTNEVLQKQVGTKILEKISDAAPYEEFSKLFILKLSGDATFAQQICAKFADNWTEILSATTSEENRTKQRQFTKELLLEDSERGKIFRQKVSAVVLLDLNASKIIEAQDWTKIIAALWKESNRQVLISLWQQQSDLVEYFAFGEWAKLNDGADFKQFVADPKLTLQNLLSLFDDAGKARRELGIALNIVVGSIAAGVKVGAAATISLADIDKCSKLPGMDLAVLVDFYIKNWEAYNAQSSADNMALTARWLSADNVCGKQFRQKFSVGLLQKIAPEQLAASIKLLRQDNPVLVAEYLSKLDFTGLQKNSAVIGDLITKTDYLAKVEKFDDVLRFFDADGMFYCADVASKQKVVDRLLQLLPYQFATITAEQVRKLSAIHDDKISSQLEQWATKSWDVFAGLPVDLRVAIINGRVHRGRIFEVQFLVEHFNNFVSLVKTDVAFAQGLSSGAYSGLFLAAINNKKEASPVIELIKQYGKYEALTLLLNKQSLQFVQQKENFGFFTPLCDGYGLDALETSTVDAADLLKFFDGAGKIIPEFAAILTRPRIVAKIISIGSFSLQGTEVLAAARQKPSDAASSGTVVNQREARELARVAREKEAAEKLARYQAELSDRAAEIEKKIEELEQQLKQVRAETVQNVVKIKELENSLSAAKQEKLDITMAKKAEDERQREKEKLGLGKQKLGSGFSGIMGKLAQTLQPVGVSSSAVQVEPKPVKIKIVSSNAVKAQLDFAQVKALISLATDNITGLELAIAHLLGVLLKCKSGTEATECQVLLKSLLEKNNLVIPSIIAALRAIGVSEQLKHIRILGSYIAEFFKSLQTQSIALPRDRVVDVLKYFLQFEFNPKAERGLPQGPIVEEINGFFAQHPEYYDYVVTDANDDELLSMMQKNPSVFVQAVNSQKLSAGALVKLFSRLGVLEAKNAQDLISAIADQHDAGLMLFAYLAELAPEARRALTKYETGFVKRWWEKNQAEFIAKISEVQAPVLRAMLSYRIEDVDIAGAVFASADGAKKCIDGLSPEELKQYEKLIVSMLPQAVVIAQKKKEEDGAGDQKQPKQQFSSQAEEMAARLKARGGAQMGETGAAKSSVVVTPAEREKFIKGLNVELVAKLLQIGSTQINQKLCCVDVGVLLLVLSCGELGKTVVNQQKAGVTALLAKPGINLVGFNRQHWAILIEAGVQIPLLVYQTNCEWVGEFLFGKGSSELLKTSALTACPAFFVVDVKIGTIGGFRFDQFTDVQLKVLLQSIAKEQQTLLVELLLARKPQLIADLFAELKSDDIARQWNVFKGWLSQQLSSQKLSKEQVEKLLVCKNPEIKLWLGDVFVQQSVLVESIFKTQQSIVGNEKFFLPYLESLFVDYSSVMIDLSSGSMDLTAEKISAEDMRKCLGSQDGKMQVWLGSVYAQAPQAVTALLNSLDAVTVQQNYCTFKPVVLAATNVGSSAAKTAMSSENLAKFFDANGQYIGDEVAADVAKLFRAKSETLVELIKYKYSDTDFIKGFVQNNFALLQDLLPQFTDTTVIRAILEYSNAELWTKLFSNEGLFRIAISDGVISALKDQHYAVILSDKATRATLKDPAFSSVATACGSMLGTWCNTVATLDKDQKQIMQDCFKDEQVRDLFFNIDRITVSQVAALAKIGDEIIVNMLLDNVDRKIIIAFFATTNGKQLQSIADENPAFAKVVFDRGMTKPDIFKATFVTGRSSEYRQKQFNQWLALAVDKKDIKALNILLVVQDGAFLVNAYNELPQARKVALMEFSPSFISAISSQEQKVAQPMLGGSTSAAMSKFAAMDYVDISAVLKVKDEGEWARLSANAEFVKSLQREFNALIKRETYDTQALSRLALFLSNRFACVGLEPYLLLRAIAAVANNGKDVVWQDVKLTIKHFDEKLAGSNPEAKSFVTYATHIVTEKLKLLEQQQVHAETVVQTM